MKKRRPCENPNHPETYGAEAGQKHNLLTRTSYIIFRAQCKIKMRDPLSKKQEFQDSDSRVLNQVRGLPQCRSHASAWVTGP